MFSKKSYADYRRDELLDRFLDCLRQEISGEIPQSEKIIVIDRYEDDTDEDLERRKQEAIAGRARKLGISEGALCRDLMVIVCSTFCPRPKGEAPRIPAPPSPDNGSEDKGAKDLDG